MNFNLFVDKNNPKEGIHDLMLLSVIIAGCIFQVYVAAIPANLAILLYNIDLNQAFYINFGVLIALETIYVKFILKKFYSVRNL